MVGIVVHGMPHRRKRRWYDVENRHSAPHEWYMIIFDVSPAKPLGLFARLGEERVAGLGFEKAQLAHAIFYRRHILVGPVSTLEERGYLRAGGSQKVYEDEGVYLGQGVAVRREGGMGGVFPCLCQGPGVSCQ